MIKKITTEQLRVGMFLHELNYKGEGNSAFMSQTIIKSDKAIHIIHSWGIKELYINTELGLDVDHNNKTFSEQEGHKKKLRIIKERGHSSAPYIPLKEEAKIAQRIKREAVDVMQRAMDSVQEGKDIDIDSAYQLVEKMEESVSRNKDALLLLTSIRNKDEYTLMHSISVSSLALAFCNSYDMSYHTTINLAMGALLHDIGKTHIPNSILNKPGRLSDEEFTIIKKHTEYSAEILANTKGLPTEAFEIALHHHERCDGSGYPHGLKESDIGLGPKIVSICDVYDAITSNRCYKKGIDGVGGLQKLYECSNYHFDKEMTYKFIRFIGVYPVGTYVKLENKLVGVVTGSTENILQPVVRIFYNDKRKTAVKIQDIDLSKININVASYDSPENWDGEKTHLFNTCRNELDPLR